LSIIYTWSLRTGSWGDGGCWFSRVASEKITDTLKKISLYINSLCFISALLRQKWIGYIPYKSIIYIIDFILLIIWLGLVLVLSLVFCFASETIFPCDRSIESEYTQDSPNFDRSKYNHLSILPDLESQV
jgi:hypothetical protein